MAYLQDFFGNFWGENQNPSLAKEKSSYQVLWASIGRPGEQNEEPLFEAHDDDEAKYLFEQNYKRNQRYAGDILTLIRIVKPQEVEVIAKVTISIADGEPM